METMYLPLLTMSVASEDLRVMALPVRETTPCREFSAAKRQEAGCGHRPMGREEVGEIEVRTHFLATHESHEFAKLLTTHETQDS